MASFDLFLSKYMLKHKVSYDEAMTHRTVKEVQAQYLKQDMEKETTENMMRVRNENRCDS